MFVEDKAPGEAPATDVASQILLDSAAYLRKHGWIQRTMEMGERVCAIGAIRKVPASAEEKQLAVRKLSHFILAKEYKMDATAGSVHLLSRDIIVSYNDAYCRTAEDIINAMEGAAREPLNLLA